MLMNILTEVHEYMSVTVMTLKCKRHGNGCYTISTSVSEQR